MASRLIRARPADGERGSVTAELATGLPMVIFLLALLLTLASASGAQMRALDAARAGARAAAIGETSAGISAAVTRVGGDDAAASLAREGSWVTVTVSKPIAGVGVIRLPLRISASATAWAEP